MNKEELIEFENDIIKSFENKEIRAPIHLDNGNEEQLIQIFNKYVKPEDWVCCSWRSHYKCLLKGVPPEQLKAQILKGKSIALSFPSHNIISSAIVGGIVPIALGIAKAIKLKGEKNKVFCFVGDMTMHSGIFLESYNYSISNNLPIMWVIEDNEKSVCTPTKDVCKSNIFINQVLPHYQLDYDYQWYSNKENKVIYYKYKSKYPHSGGLNRIQF